MHPPGRIKHAINAGNHDASEGRPRPRPRTPPADARIKNVPLGGVDRERTHHGAVTTAGYWAAAAAVPAGREGESEIVGGEYCAGSAQPYPTGHPGPGEHYADDRGAAAPAGYWAAAAALTEERDDGYNMIGGFTRA